MPIMKKAIMLMLAPLFAAALHAADYDITDFGARPDKGFLNTEKIQAAIDRCSAEGGGRVIVPRGEFLTGTVCLKSRVTLYLEHGAKLQGSSRMEDYTKHLVRADNADGIGIEGYGIIDGSGHSFWYVKENGHYDHDRPVPGYMIYFENCKDVRISGVRFQNAESWTVHLLGCSEVRIRDIIIRNPLHGPNNDGIDIQSCQNVTISGCDIYTSDDAIVLKNRHPRYNIRPCANITVTNCILTCVCNAFKIGTETIGQFRNITFSNSTIRQAQPTDSLARIRVKDMNMPIRAISGISIESVDGSLVDGVAVSNITMENVRCPIFIRLANRGAGVQKKTPPVPGEVKNVVISGVTVRNAWYASSITAIPGCHVENVILRDIIVRMRGKKDPSLPEKTVDEKVDAYPDAHMWGDLPASAFFVRHADGIFMDNIVCNLDAEENRPVAIFEDVKHLSADGIYVDGKYVGESAFRLVRTSDARFSGCRVPEGVKFAVDMRGQENSCIRIEGMDPSRVRSEKSSQIQQIISFEVK